LQLNWGKSFVVGSGGGGEGINQRRLKRRPLAADDPALAARRVEAERGARRRAALARLVEQRARRARDKEARAGRRREAKAAAAAAAAEKVAAKVAAPMRELLGHVEEEDEKEDEGGDGGMVRAPPRQRRLRLGDEPPKNTSAAAGVVAAAPVAKAGRTGEEPRATGTGAPGKGDPDDGNGDGSEDDQEDGEDAVLDVSSDESESVSGGGSSEDESGAVPLWDVAMADGVDGGMDSEMRMDGRPESAASAGSSRRVEADPGDRVDSYDQKEEEEAAETNVDADGESADGVLKENVDRTRGNLGPEGRPSSAPSFVPPSAPSFGAAGVASDRQETQGSPSASRALASPELFTGTRAVVDGEVQRGQPVSPAVPLLPPPAPPATAEAAAVPLTLTADAVDSSGLEGVSEQRRPGGEWEGGARSDSPSADESAESEDERLAIRLFRGAAAARSRSNLGASTEKGGDPNGDGDSDTDDDDDDGGGGGNVRTPLATPHAAALPLQPFSARSRTPRPTALSEGPESEGLVGTARTSAAPGAVVLGALQGSARASGVRLSSCTTAAAKGPTVSATAAGTAAGTAGRAPASTASGKVSSSRAAARPSRLGRDSGAPAVTSYAPGSLEARLLRSFPTFGSLFTCYYEGKGNGAALVDGWAPHGGGGGMQQPASGAGAGVGSGKGPGGHKGRKGASSSSSGGGCGAAGGAWQAYGLSQRDEETAMERTWRLCVELRNSAPRSLHHAVNL